VSGVGLAGWMRMGLGGCGMGLVRSRATMAVKRSIMGVRRT